MVLDGGSGTCVGITLLSVLHCYWHWYRYFIGIGITLDVCPINWPVLRRVIIPLPHFEPSLKYVVNLNSVKRKITFKICLKIEQEKNKYAIKKQTDHLL